VPNESFVEAESYYADNLAESSLVLRRHITQMLLS